MERIKTTWKNFIIKKKLIVSYKIIPYTKNPFKYVMNSDVKVLSSRFEGNPNILLKLLV